jgi:hypothetical protein
VSAFEESRRGLARGVVYACRNAERSSAKADRNEWARRMQRWPDSGLTAREFASEMGLSCVTDLLEVATEEGSGNGRRSP